MNQYQIKDIKKFSVCTTLISRGAPGSSSDKYAKDPSILNIQSINKLMYTVDDIVGVSVNGRRTNRISFDKELVKLAVEAGATIIADNKINRLRSFNIGERELWVFLVELGACHLFDNSVRAGYRKKIKDGYNEDTNNIAYINS